ncbi:MAG: aminoacetone oxidase family FAD-binding enzyme [Roseburia sp.]|nr:aminoacetone oxidase family FAD-binding enzyme [Roseburia sp.]MCM1430958.1 aminoacetone oxidase family FAD-binding enzyme [Muribaculaceae bacterium]
MGNTVYSAIVIGAGASGMTAAITAARRGLSVLVLEQEKRPGKKLLATGNGKCNFTNEQLSEACYHGDSALIAAVLEQFSLEDCLVFFHGIGVLPKKKRGYYYPNSGQAASVADALAAEIDRLGVTLVTEACVTSVESAPNGFICRTEQRTYRGKNLLFATGLLASPKLGSDGSAIPLIKKMGHRFAPVLPALCGFYCEGMDFRRASGVRCDAELTLFIDGRRVGSERGELQLTGYGLSGIPMFQLSSVAVRGLYEKRTVQIYIDFLPELEASAVEAELSRRRRRQEEADISQMLCGLLHSKLIPACAIASGLSERQRAKSLSGDALHRLAAVCKAFPVTLLRPREMEYAQVCTGGVYAREVNPRTLESRLFPGLYFAGELLDVDGICGGYNLHWAWATGYVAGSSMK